MPVPVPSPAASDVALCARLTPQLPTSLEGAHRHPATPRSRLTAAWGTPAIVLRCGVPQPAIGEEAPLTVNDKVAWLQHIGGDAVEWTVLDRGVFIEVSIPKAYAAQANILLDLTDLVARTLPKRPLPKGA